jgi:hypothetical protein
MSFQWIIDNAESISINRKRLVSQTTARDGTVRSVSRGGQPWRFEVRLPDGPRWTDYRNNISKAEALDRVTSSTVSFSNAGHDWLIQYTGDLTDTSSLTYQPTTPGGGNQITLTGGYSGLTVGEYIFRAGDVIQLNSEYVYTVAADVAYNQNTVTLHRPLVDPSSTGAIAVGANCVWTVRCVEFPDWTLFARDQVSWSGPFVFVEDLTA